MTIPSEVSPETAEVAGVEEAHARRKRLKAIGALKLDLAAIGWAKLCPTGYARGAIAPDAAQASLTRDSQRRWALARQARRGNPAAMLAAALIR